MMVVVVVVVVVVMVVVIVVVVIVVVVVVIMVVVMSYTVLIFMISLLVASKNGPFRERTCQLFLQRMLLHFGLAKFMRVRQFIQLKSLNLSVSSGPLLLAGLQTCREGGNKMNKQSETAEKRWSSGLALNKGLTNPQHKK
jgi:hypothetical protein